MTNFSYQLLSSRKFDSLEETLGMLSQLGYSQVEGYEELITDERCEKKLHELLKYNALTMPTAHFSLKSVAENATWVIQVCKTLGVKVVIVPSVDLNQRPTNAVEWQGFAKLLERISIPFLDEGLEFAWHNCAYEFIDVDSTDKPLKIILDTAPNLLLEIDLAWAFVGGEDPTEWLHQYKDRIVAAHIKDVAKSGDNSDEDGWSDLGFGVMDWRKLAKELNKTAVQYFVLEHDNPSDHHRFAKRSIQAANALGIK
jgi:sugar phosphate isomerase/epimerase